MLGSYLRFSIHTRGSSGVWTENGSVFEQEVEDCDLSDDGINAYEAISDSDSDDSWFSLLSE